MLNPRLLVGITKQDPELASILEKWTPKIENVVRGIVRDTHELEEDVYQSVLCKIVQDVQAYRKNQVRFHPTGVKKRQIWNVIEEFPDAILAYRGEVVSLISRSKIEAIPKASLSTFVYLGIEQHASDVYGRFFKKKNGFAKEAAAAGGMVFNRAARKMVPVTRGHYVRAVTTIPIQDFITDDGTESDLPASDTKTPEEILAHSHLLARIREGLHPDLFEALLHKMEGSQPSSPEPKSKKTTAACTAARNLYKTIHAVRTSEVRQRELVAARLHENLENP